MLQADRTGQHSWQHDRMKPKLGAAILGTKLNEVRTPLPRPAMCAPATAGAQKDD